MSHWDTEVKKCHNQIIENRVAAATGFSVSKSENSEFTLRGRKNDKF